MALEKGCMRQEVPHSMRPSRQRLTARGHHSEGEEGKGVPRGDRDDRGG